MVATIARVNGINLHYKLRGPHDAPVVVFSNSLGTDFRIWDDVVDRLSGYRTLVYDTRGHGLSDCPDDQWGMGDNVADLAALMDHLDLSAAAVCGLSVGGLIAQGLAAERADLVRLLILSNTAAKIGNVDTWQPRIDAVRAGGIASVSGDILDRWFAPSFIKTNANLPAYRAMLERTPLDGYWKTCHAISETDLMESTARLTLPAMAIVGTQDGATPPDLVRETAGLIAGCRFELIKNAGHIPCVEHPDTVADLLLGFMKENGHG